MRSLSIGLASLLGSTVLACAGVGTPASHAQEAMSGVAENLRFGRTELVMERISPDLKDQFAKQHAAWGGRVTIAETEFGNFKMTGKEDAEDTLRITWYDGNQELRSTLLHQKWHGDKGNWLLVSEERVDGDLGLLGETVVVQSPDEAHAPRAQFPTVRIGAND
jgi:hypothetical protein